MGFNWILLDLYCRWRSKTRQISCHLKVYNNKKLLRGEFRAKFYKRQVLRGSFPIVDVM
jgi:hypothetical protein